MTSTSHRPDVAGRVSRQRTVMAQHDALTVATVADHQPRMQPQRRALECDRGGQRVAGPRRVVRPRAAQRQRRAPRGRGVARPGTDDGPWSLPRSARHRRATVAGPAPARALVRPPLAAASRRACGAPAGRGVDGRRGASAAGSPQLPMLTALPLNRPPGAEQDLPAVVDVRCHGSTGPARVRELHAGVGRSVRGIDGLKAALSLPQVAVQHTIGVDVLPHDLAAVVDAEGRGRGVVENVGGLGRVDLLEAPLGVEVAVVAPLRVGIAADDLTPIVDVRSEGVGGGRVVGGVRGSSVVSLPLLSSRKP